MFGGMAYKIGILAKKATGGGADVTPDAVSWGGGSPIYGSIPTITSDTKTITGINTSINLYYECVYCGDGGTIEYSKNSGAWTPVSELSNISIANNDTLAWRYSNSGGVITVDIKNASDGNAVIDQLDFQFL